MEALIPIGSVFLAAFALWCLLNRRREKCRHCCGPFPSLAVYCPRCGRNESGRRAEPKADTWKPVMTPAPPPVIRTGTVMRGPGGQLAILTTDFVHPASKPSDTWVVS